MNTLFGPDGSAFQDDIILKDHDWDAISYGLWRCIHQSGRLDRTYRPMCDAFQAHNKPFATYVYLDDMDAQRKADLATLAIADKSIPVMVDWEDDACQFDDLVEFIDIMRDYGYRVPSLYTGKAFWQSMGSPTLAGLGVDLVIARYGDQKPGGTYNIQTRYAYMLPKYSVWNWDIGGLQPSVWQYGSRIRWGDQYMDMNAIRDEAVIGRMFKDWTPPQPPTDPIEEDDDMVWMVAKDAGNGNSWEASPDGRSRLQMPDQVAVEVVFASGRAWDVAAKRWVSSIDAVQPIAAADVTAKLGPRAR